MMISFINKKYEEFKNTSKKLILARIVILVIIVLFLVLIFVFVKNTSSVLEIKDSKRYTIATKSYAVKKEKVNLATKSNIDKKSKKPKEKIEKKKKTTIETADSTPHIFKYIEFVKGKLRSNSGNDTSYFAINKNNDTEDRIIKPALYNDEAKRIQNLYNNKRYEKDAWLLIDEDKDGYGYNYYFDSKGKLLIDTITPDYRYVNIDGKEVDNELNPIVYDVKYEPISTESSIVKEHTLADVIYSPGASRKSKSKVYDASVNRDMTLYISDSLRFKKRTNGTIFNGSKWKQVSSIKDDGGYVIFENPNINFNKVVGKIAIQDVTKDEYRSIRNTLYVYDADTPHLSERYDVDPIYEVSTNEDIVNFSFTFKRTIKHLKFYVISDSDEYKPISYLKSLKYGFNNEAYKDELEEAESEEAYKNYMKELGIYIDNEEEYLSYINENVEDDYYEYEDFNDIGLYDDEYIDSLDYEIDRDYDKEQARIDRVTGPAFDELLKKAIDFFKTGPAFDENFNKNNK